MAAPGLKDKIPPHNDEAEQAALGALLLDSEAIMAVVSYLKPADFYSNANRRVYEAILNLFNQSRKADIITISDELQQSGELDAAGGRSYIASLTTVVPTSANIDYYAKIIQDCSLRRSMLRISSEITAGSFDETADSRLTLEKAQQEMFDLTEGRQTITFKSAKEIIPKTIDNIQRLYNSKDAYTGVPSGFDDLDSMTSGFQNSELVIIGARPSIGKTALAMSMAAHITIKEKRPAAFFSLEMSDMAIMQRLISSEAAVDSNKIRTGFLQPKDFTSLIDAAGKIYDAPLYILDMPNLKMLDLRAQARRLKAQQKIEIIFIDYLTLISSENYQIPRHEQIAEISRSLKSLARELEIPVVALSQVKRDADGKKPSLADIRESGSIEQDADLVMFLHRDKETEKKPEEEHSKVIKTELIIAKQRNGPVGTVDIAFIPRFTKFENLSRT